MNAPQQPSQPAAVNRQAGHKWLLCFMVSAFGTLAGGYLTQTHDGQEILEFVFKPLHAAWKELTSRKPDPVVVPSDLGKTGGEPKPPTPSVADRDVVLVFDRSQSPLYSSQNTLFAEQRAWTKDLLAGLDDRSRVSLVAVNGQAVWPSRDLPLAYGRDELNKHCDGLFPKGSSALLDGIGEAVEHLRSNGAGPAPAHVVVLTTAGQDHARRTRDDLREQLRPGASKRPVHLHAVVYGREGNAGEAAEVIGALEELARLTSGRLFRASHANKEATLLAIRDGLSGGRK